MLREGFSSVCCAKLIFVLLRFFFHALQLTKSRIANKSAEVQWATRMEELEDVNAQLCAELDAAQLILAEVEHRELALTSAYRDLKKDFEKLHSSLAAVVAEKAEVEKTKHAKL
jgi:uncharacterized protein involved in exopolysaccharide biosynthesis